MNCVGRILFVIFIVGSVCSFPEKQISYWYLDHSDRPVRSDTPPPTDKKTLGTSIYTPRHEGWAQLELIPNPALDDISQAYNAGYIEGCLTSDSIFDHWTNVGSRYCNNIKKTCARMYRYVQANLIWIHCQVAKHAATDPYWHQVNLFYYQIHGMFEGYSRAVKASPEKKLTLLQFLHLNLMSDFDDLSQALAVEGEKSKIHHIGKCSALIKLTNNCKDLLTAHNTWTKYTTMTRIMKNYNFAYHLTSCSNDIVPGRSIAFSGYPGEITSGDDYNVVSSGLVTLETTNEVIDMSLYGALKPIGQVFECVRNTVANRLAKNGSEWVTIFSKYNSGTYNNQWMVVDYNLFKSGECPKSDLLWIAEQVPGYVETSDVTSVLSTQDYWPSYNIPYFKTIYVMMGYVGNFKKFGNWYSYDENPRSKIFNRDHHKVQDIYSMMDMLHYNDYLNDPFSKCESCNPKPNACNAIAARCDLNPVNGTYPFYSLRHRLHGATDVKITNSTLVKNLQIYASSGPTHGTNLPPFQWSKLSEEDQKQPHVGQPDLWNFKPVLFNWSQC